MSSPVFVPAHARLPPGRLAAAVRGVVFGFLPPAAWLAALLLVGCSAPLPYQARDAGLPEARAAFQNRRLQGQDLAAFLAAAGERLPAAGEGWQFDALALAAGWYSADVAQAQVRWEAALERRREGWSRPALPFEAFVEHHSVTDLARPQPWTLGLGFELTLPSERRRLAREAQLDSAVALARIELARAFWAARERMRAPWLDQQLLQARLPLAVQQLTLCEQREQRSGRRLAQGEADAGELHAAQRARQQAQAAVEGVKRELAAAQARLRVALALPPDAGEVVLAPLAEDAAASAEGRSDIDALALENRLDLRAAEARFQAADAELRWEVAQQYPELGIRPGYEWDQGDHRLRIGLALPLALPSAHRAPVRQAVAEREARAHELQGQQEAVLQQVALARRAVDDALALRMARTQHWQALQQQAQAVARGERLGEFDALQRIDAELAALDQAQQLQTAELGLWRAREQLEDAVQRPLATLVDAAAAARGRRPADATQAGGQGS